MVLLPFRLHFLGCLCQPFSAQDSVKSPACTTYTWQHRNTVNSTATAINKTERILYTTENLDSLGTVTGNATLTLKGNTMVGTLETGVLKVGTGSVFGGGKESAVKGNTSVILEGEAHVLGNVFGGGDEGTVNGNTSVLIKEDD